MHLRWRPFAEAGELIHQEAHLVGFILARFTMGQRAHGLLEKETDDGLKRVMAVWRHTDIDRDALSTQIPKIKITLAGRNIDKRIGPEIESFGHRGFDK